MSTTDFTPSYRPAALAPDVRRSQAPRVWAGAVLLLGSLGMVLLAGCFLIGVLAVIDPRGAGAPAEVTGARFALMLVLYGLTVACVAAAGLLLILGAGGLVRVIYGNPRHED